MTRASFGVVPVTDHVDMVADLERAREQLVRVAVELVGALRALDLRPDALLPRRSKPPGRDLLALVDVLGCDVLGELVGRGDRARDDCLARNGLLRQELLVDDV